MIGDPTKSGNSDSEFNASGPGPCHRTVILDLNSHESSQGMGGVGILGMRNVVRIFPLPVVSL